MKTLLILFVLITGFSCLADKIRMPLLMVDEKELDLGEINFDSTYQLTYSIRNRGKGTLVIDTVSSSCGCSIPLINKKVLHPKDAAQIKVEFKPVEPGPFQKSIIIKSNMDSAFTILRFRGISRKLTQGS